MHESIFSAVLHQEEDLYMAECPEVGTVSQDATIEEAVASLKEATELYLQEFPEPKSAQGIDDHIRGEGRCLSSHIRVYLEKSFAKFIVRTPRASPRNTRWRKHGDCCRQKDLSHDSI
jgi:predicted RNase H-like HicB family nuclease